MNGACSYDNTKMQMFHTMLQQMQGTPPTAAAGPAPVAAATPALATPVSTRVRGFGKFLLAQLPVKKEKSDSDQEVVVLSTPRVKSEVEEIVISDGEDNHDDDELFDGELDPEGEAREATPSPPVQVKDDTTPPAAGALQKPIERMTVSELADLVGGISSPEVAERFRENMIDGSVVLSLSPADLDRFEPILGRRLKLQRLFGIGVPAHRVGPTTNPFVQPVNEVLMSQLEKAERKKKRERADEAGNGVAGRKAADV